MDSHAQPGYLRGDFPWEKNCQIGALRFQITPGRAGNVFCCFDLVGRREPEELRPRLRAGPSQGTHYALFCTIMPLAPQANTNSLPAQQTLPASASGKFTGFPPILGTVAPVLIGLAFKLRTQSLRPHAFLRPLFQPERRSCSRRFAALRTAPSGRPLYSDAAGRRSGVRFRHWQLPTEPRL